jgi:hypothetical protein
MFPILFAGAKQSKDQRWPTASEELSASAQWNVDKRSSCQAKHGASHGFRGPDVTSYLDSR